MFVLYAWDKCLFKDALLNCVKQYTLLMSELIQFDTGISIKR